MAKKPDPKGKHKDDKAVDKAGKRTKKQDRKAAKGGAGADQDVENSLRKLFKGLF